jgi:hypothetical protein
VVEQADCVVPVAVQRPGRGRRRRAAACTRPPHGQGHPMILRNPLRAKHHRGPSLDREPPGRVREGSKGRPGPAPADAPRRRRPASGRRDLTAWMVVSAAAVHGDVAVPRSVLGRLPNVGVRHVRVTSNELTRPRPHSGAGSSTEQQETDRHTLTATGQTANRPTETRGVPNVSGAALLEGPHAACGMTFSA